MSQYITPRDKAFVSVSVFALLQAILNDFLNTGHTQSNVLIYIMVYESESKKIRVSVGGVVGVQ